MDTSIFLDPVTLFAQYLWASLVEGALAKCTTQTGQGKGHVFLHCNIISIDIRS